jgi:prophage regulatory protein
MSVVLVGGYKALREKKGIKWSRQHLGRLERRGKFPKRTKIGPNTIDWVEDEIDGWLAEKRAARDAKPD